MGLKFYTISIFSLSSILRFNLYETSGHLVVGISTRLLIKTIYAVFTNKQSRSSLDSGNNTSHYCSFRYRITSKGSHWGNLSRNVQTLETEDVHSQTKATCQPACVFALRHHRPQPPRLLRCLEHPYHQSPGRRVRSGNHLQTISYINVLPSQSAGLEYFRLT